MLDLYDLGKLYEQILLSNDSTGLVSTHQVADLWRFCPCQLFTGKDFSFVLLGDGCFIGMSGGIHLNVILGVYSP